MREGGMTTIDLEAHFYTKAVFDYLEKRKQFPLLVREKEGLDIPIYLHPTTPL
jgi:hypothetical protein